MQITILQRKKLKPSAFSIFFAILLLAFFPYSPLQPNVKQRSVENMGNKYSTHGMVGALLQFL